LYLLLMFPVVVFGITPKCNYHTSSLLLLKSIYTFVKAK
jgi:hypothetical protein